LPNDPNVKSLTEFQRRWIYYNILSDNEKHIKDLEQLDNRVNETSYKIGNTEYTKTSYQVDDDVFEERLRKRKERKNARNS